MADVLINHNNLIALLPRIGISLGFGEKSVKQVCSDDRVSLPMFLLISNVYTQDDYIPDLDELLQCPIEEVVQYLTRSHEDYLHYIFPHIEQHLAEVVMDWNAKYKTLITNFFYEYKKEVELHFKYEEEVVFPYIRTLVRHEGSSKATLKKSMFDKQHTNIEDKLRDFTNLMVKFIPAEVAQRERVDMLADICSLSVDIEKHALIEEKVLIPYIIALQEDEDK